MALYESTRRQDHFPPWCPRLHSFAECTTVPCLLPPPGSAGHAPVASVYSEKVAFESGWGASYLAKAVERMPPVGRG